MDPSHPYCYFLEDDKFLETDRPGFRRRVITGEHLQLCFWRIEGGATGVPAPPPEHEQFGIIVRGKLDFRIGDPDERRAGRARRRRGYLAPKAVWHGDSVFIGDDEYDECWILDVFSPPRDDLAKEG
jgi:hypothetical protein